MPIHIIIPEADRWNNSLHKFETLEEEYHLTLEHSLLSISKWEQKWHKPFMKEDVNKTYEETCDYIRCMTLEEDIPEKVYGFIPDDVILKVNEYIKDPATATWFTNNSRGGNGHIANQGSEVTAELVYYYMIKMHIPLEFETRHYNHLMTLIKVIQTKDDEGEGKNKMSKGEVLAQQARLNKQRRAALKAKKGGK